MSTTTRTLTPRTIATEAVKVAAAPVAFALLGLVLALTLHAPAEYARPFVAACGIVGLFAPYAAKAAVLAWVARTDR